MADAGALVVWHYDPERQAARADRPPRPVAGIPGFIVPSPYFDVAVAPDGLLRVANPGMPSGRGLHLRRPPGALLGQARHGHRGLLRLLQPVEHRHLGRRPGGDGRKGNSAGESLQRVGRVRVRRGGAGNVLAPNRTAMTERARSSRCIRWTWPSTAASASWCSIRRPAACEYSNTNKGKRPGLRSRGLRAP